jgi:peptidyl-prolyl cis-trans isomerase C
MMTVTPSADPQRPARRRLGRPVPVSVNDVVIASADIARETQHHQSSDPD